jgi:hypothetical protein
MLAAAGLVITAAAEACDLPTGVAPRGRVEAAGIVVVFNASPPAIEVGRHFTLDIRVCAEGGAPGLTRLDVERDGRRTRLVTDLLLE